MKKLIAIAVNCAITISVCMTLIAARPASAGASRVVDNSDTVVLRGHVHPHARPEYDTGAVDPSLPMNRMILSLRLSSDKQAEMDQLLVEQQDPASPNFHRWLTPEEFGERFGPTPEEIGVITDWLTSQGFAVDEVAKGRTWINFSGKVSDVEQAFHTQIHSYYVDGHHRQANATDPAIPRGLADLVSGPVSLHNFPLQAMNRRILPPVTEETQPDYTNQGSHWLGPGDFAIIYNVNALYSAGFDGTGQSIAIVGRTHPSSTNWATFRSTFGLPANPPQVIVNGTDPGDLGAGEDGEADLDVEWSGAVAKNATIKFVVSASTSSTDGVDLSAQYIITNNIAPVMSTSFGLCETLMGTTSNNFYNNLWAQAASQGITSFVSTGDSGAAGCDSASASSANSGLAVNGLASTPYNVAVGGTQFNEGSGSYWSSSNSSTNTSALSYIPEVAWNESGSATSCPAGDTCSELWSTGGGASSRYSKPAWQVSPGVPSDGMRDIPDVSLSGAGHDGYAVQTQSALHFFGGTSASSPSFAGLMALIVQATGQRQGNANPRFYQLGNAQYGSSGPAVFHDITSGNNSVPGLTGYSCTAGYDRATGLGSVDAYALATNWATVVPDFSLAAPAAVSAVQGTSGTATVSTTITIGFNSAVALSASGLPAGATYGFNPASIAAPGSGSSTLTLTAGAATPTGTYSVTVTGTGGGKTHSATISFSVTPAPIPDFTISASPTSLSADQGTSITSTISTTVTFNFNAAVALSASGLPAGASYGFNPASIAAPGSGSSILTLTAGAATPTGTYSVTVTGTGGSTTHTATISFTVTAPDFTISASPTSRSAVQGTSVATTISTTVTPGFNAAVALSASGLPSGASYGFSTASIPAPGSGSSTLTLTAGAATPAGTYSVTVTGTGGSTTHTATISFTVTVPPPPDFTISATPNTLSAAQGASVATTISTNATGGFNAALALAASGLPPGATYGLSPSSIPAPGFGDSILTLTAGAATPVGTYSVTVTGTGGGDTRTVIVYFTVTAPDFTILASPTTLSAVQGASVGTTIGTTATGGFNAALALSASGLPSGASYGFSPVSVPAPGSGSSTLTLTAGAATPAGTYSVTVTGTGGGKTHTATISFTVTAAPDFTILASPTSLSAVQGTSVGTTISTTVIGGFNAAVALTASGLPSGATYGFSPDSIPAPGSGSSTLTLTAGAATPVGTYSVTVTGTGSGTTHTATISFTITATPTPDFTISASPTSLSAVQGASAATTISTNVVGGFNAAVALTATGLPAGARATFSPTKIAAPGSGSSILTLKAGALTPTGTYSVTVTGKGGGTTHTATILFTVADFTLTAPAAVTAVRGGSTMATVSTTGTGSFDNDVLLSATGLPAGATYSFSPANIAAPGSGSTTLTLTAGAATPTGTFKVKVIGTGGGKTHTAVISFKVADFKVTAAPITVTVARGSSGNATLKSTVTSGFNAEVDLAVSGLPSGATATFSQTSFAAPGSGSAILTLTADASVPVGTYPLTVTGTGGGNMHTAVISLKVK